MHRCVGSDGRADPGRIAEVIARCAPDIVGLQELDVKRRRTGSVDQAELIARDLGMAVHFHPAFSVEQEHYGDAILTALPMRLVKAAALPGLPNRPFLEPRGALWVAVKLADELELQVFNTHLGLLAAERAAQVGALLGEAWLGHPACQGKPVVLLGDFNAVPRSRAHARLRQRLADAVLTLPPGQGGPRATFPSRWPLLRLDHVFLSEGVEALRAEVPCGREERRASDHLPLVVDLRVTASVDQPLSAAGATGATHPPARTDLRAEAP